MMDPYKGKKGQEGRVEGGDKRGKEQKGKLRKK